MTKSTITRERLEKIAAGRVDARRCNDDEIAMAITLLAAMDSESVGTLSVRHMSYSGKKIGNQFGFVHSDAAMTIAEGDYPLYRHAQPVPVVPDEMTSEQAYKIGDYHGDPVDVFARGANWMRQHIIDSILAAAPQAAPVVPKEMTAGIAVKHWEGGRGSIESFIAGYNFCRAAILAAAPQEEKP